MASKSPPSQLVRDSFSNRVGNIAAKFAVIGVLFAGLTYLELQVVSNRPHVDNMKDHFFELFAPLLEWFWIEEHLIVSGAIAEGSLAWWLNPSTLILLYDTLFLMGVGIVVMFILLSSYGTRVGSAITLSHSLRAVCLCLVEFPTPAMAIWRKPGFPSEGANDYFFSGHMSIPMIAAMEMSRRGYHSLALFVHLANAGQFLCMVGGFLL